MGEGYNGTTIACTEYFDDIRCFLCHVFLQRFIIVSITFPRVIRRTCRFV